MGGILIMMALLNLADGKDPDLGEFSDAAQGIKTNSWACMHSGGCQYMLDCEYLPAH